MKSKSIAKSIRLSDEIFAYIDEYRGNGFNEKFENIILDAMLSEKDRKMRLASLDLQIKARMDFLNDINSRLTDVSISLEALGRDIRYHR